MKIYRAKPNTWFMAGSLAELIDDYTDGTCTEHIGLFRGVRVCQNAAAEAVETGVAYLDEEVCGFDEFEFIGEIKEDK